MNWQVETRANTHLLHYKDKLKFGIFVHMVFSANRLRNKREKKKNISYNTISADDIRTQQKSNSNPIFIE